MYEIKTYYKNTMPYKLELQHKKSGIKLTYYKSTTEFLSFLNEEFNIQIYGESQRNYRTQKTPSSGVKPQMQILF